MKFPPITTIIGVAKIVIILGGAATYFIGHEPLGAVTAAVVAFEGLLAGVGFIQAQDSGQKEQS